MYVNLLSQAMPADVECVFADTPSDIRHACVDFRPDIIHLHGRQTAVTEGLPVPPPRIVVSPHGENVDTASAYAVIARSPYELNHLHDSRKTMVRDPLITSTITFDEAAAVISAVYRRVMNSDPLQLMDQTTRQAMAVMLATGICGDSRWYVGQPWKDRAAEIDFHHLYIYAEEEGVLSTLMRGIALLGLTAPEKAPTDMYLPDGYKRPAPMEGASIPQMLQDIERNGLSLLRLAELTKALHSDSLDEAALMAQTEELKLRPTLQAVLQVLSEQTLLTEGFMPCPPLDNDDAERLRWQLETRQQIINENP